MAVHQSQITTDTHGEYIISYFNWAGFKSSLPQSWWHSSWQLARRCSYMLPLAPVHQRQAVIVGPNSSLYEHLVACCHQICCQPPESGSQVLKCKILAFPMFSCKWYSSYLLRINSIILNLTHLHKVCNLQVGKYCIIGNVGRLKCLRASSLCTLVNKCTRWPLMICGSLSKHVLSLCSFQITPISSKFLHCQLQSQKV